MKKNREGIALLVLGLLFLSTCQSRMGGSAFFRKLDKMQAPEAELDRPESIYFDSDRSLPFVSDPKGKQILVRAESEEIYRQVMPADGPMGLHRVKDLIYFADGANGNGEVIGFSVRSGKEKFRIHIPEADSLQLNDVTSDGKERLWVSDRQGDKIYEIKLSTGKYRQLCDTQGKVANPNGLWWDAAQERILGCNIESGKKGKIFSIDPRNGELKILRETEYFHLDGIVMNQAGDVFVSSWGEDWKHSVILKWKGADFSQPARIELKTDCGVADLGYSAYGSRGDSEVLTFPCWWEHSTRLYNLEKP